MMAEKSWEGKKCRRMIGKIRGRNIGATSYDDISLFLILYKQRNLM